MDDIATTFHRGLLVAPDCTGCPLRGSRIVPPEGNPRARIVLVGEAPGMQEEQEGKPFCGPSGNMLNLLLKRAEISRSDLWITNSALCLEGPTQTRFADGTRRRISDVVANRLRGPVLSMHNGELVAAEITGWHRSALDGREVRAVKFRSARRAGTRGLSNGRFTVDHTFLTPDGWKPAGDVNGGLIATGCRRLQGPNLDVFVGTILGDAHFARSTMGFVHALDQEGFARWKARALTALSPRISYAEAGPNNVQRQIRVHTRASRWITRLHTGEGRRLLHEPLAELIRNHLTDLALAVWFCDDGYTRLYTSPGRRPQAELATNGFDFDEVEFLRDLLAARGLPTKLFYNTGWRLTFGAEISGVLLRRIAPYVPPDLDYKLPPELRGQFDPRVFDPLPPTTDWDVAEVTPRLARRPTVYCIDVAATGNFVTTAGVVHNCRSKTVEIDGKPLAPEKVVRIAATHCRSRLLGELGVVQPAVIVPLGGVAFRSVHGGEYSLDKRRGGIHTVDVLAELTRLNEDAVPHVKHKKKAKPVVEDDDVVDPDDEAIIAVETVQP